ncbi:MAG: hypothetical protein ABSB70_09895 [Candidatus Velthaea sp.]
MNDKLVQESRKMMQGGAPLVRPLPGAAHGVSGGPAQDIGREAGAFIANRVEQIDGFDLATTGPLFRQFDDLADPRGDEDSFPRAVVAHAERALDLRMNVRAVDVPFPQPLIDAGIVLLEKSVQHVFRSHVVMVVVAAFLLGGTQHASRRRAEM